jgi:PAS domain S-box-containing protein
VPTDVSPWVEKSAPGADDLYRSALQAIPAHTAVLDRSGTILLVNDAWTAFALANGAAECANVAVGANYLEVCENAATEFADADRVLSGIRAVLDGSLPLFEMEYPCHSPCEQRWFLMSVTPFAHGSQGGVIISHSNTTARKLAEQALAASEQRFRATFDHAAVGIAHISPEGRWLAANRRLCQIAGYPREELLAKSLADIVHPEDLDADKAHIEVMRAGGNDSCRLEQRLVQKDGSVVWVVTTLGCVRTETGAIDYLVVGVEDVSDQKRVEQHQQTLLRELSHRGKNLLSVIMSIVGRTLSGDRSLSEAREAVVGRLTALSKSYETLTKETFDRAPLEAILRNALQSFGGRVHLDGPTIMLTAKATQMIAIVAHELATNAAKYGALSVSEGHVLVTWELAGDPSDRRLVFTWREKGGPPAEAPSRHGFGSVLISQVAGMEFGCEPELSYGGEGFRYRFEAPLDALGSALVDSPVRRRLKNAIVCTLYDTWARQRHLGGLPKLDGFHWSQFAATGALTIAEIGSNGDVRFLQVGRALIERLGSRVDEIQAWAEEDTNTLAEVYRRCAEAGEPCHEFMRINFGDGDPLTFERLLVPFSATAGRRPSHVAGIVVFEGSTAPARES